MGDPNYVGVYFPFSSLFIEEGRVWNYLRIAPECLDELFVYTFQGQYYTIN